MVIYSEPIKRGIRLNFAKECKTLFNFSAFSMLVTLRHICLQTCVHEYLYAMNRRQLLNLTILSAKLSNDFLLIKNYRNEHMTFGMNLQNHISQEKLCKYHNTVVKQS